MTTVYISHPIKGLTEAEASNLERRGTHWCELRDLHALRPRSIQPFCLQMVGRDRCKPDGSAGDGATHTHACFMRGDLVALLEQADWILMMPGWEQSVGCKAELNAALAAGITIKFYE